MTIQSILRGQYARAMANAYAFARQSVRATPNASAFLDCGCGIGQELQIADDDARAGKFSGSYTGLEWGQSLVDEAVGRGLNVLQADLNEVLPLPSASQDCVSGFSVLEHLLMPCHFLTECHRVLRPGGRLVILTPNISTWFTAALIVAGRMPSSGPHPDSNSLVKRQELVRVSNNPDSDLSAAMPEHRHLVVFSFLALRHFMKDAGFRVDAARGFGYYPLPKFTQPLFESIDPYHCHQMVFVCRKN